jgi:hypothetical protein
MAATKLITSTIQAWQPYYEQPLTHEDGAEIVNNWASYIGVISEWTTAYQNRHQETALI